MTTRRITHVLSTFLPLAFVAAMLMPSLPLVPPSQAQTTPRDANGSSSRAAEELESKFDRSESYDKAEVEADPNAPDDREQSGSAPAATLFPIPVPLPGGIDHVANGTGARNAGFGNIRLRGVPPGSVPVRAFLYWGVIMNAPPPVMPVLFKGVAVKGQLIGTGQTCWCGGVFAAYRASVIALINPGVNSDYLVSRIPSAITDGRDAWDAPCALPLAQGASLVVLYANASVPPAARVFINDGVTFFAVGGVNVLNPLTAPVPPYTQLKHTRLGADGQVGGSTFSNLPVTDERTFLGPALTQIKGPLSPFNGDSDWNGDDGTPLNQLWDTHTDRFTKQLVPVGAGGYVVRYTANGDCIYAVAHVLGTR